MEKHVPVFLPDKTMIHPAPPPWHLVVLWTSSLVTWVWMEGILTRWLGVAV